ncbi:MAG: hypothetical protein KA795_06030, partial [Burkholderiaceae bacterium]|nr:hypothetical protein [Burkholderiaceae bacterium]
MKAVSASEGFIKNMRNAATLTATAAKNLIEISANAQKMGIADSIDPLIKGMTSTNTLFRESSQQVKSLLFNSAAAVGRINELQNGTILQSKEGIKDMARGLENQLKLFGVSGVEAIDQMSDEAKMKLNLQIKAAFGMELGEFRKTIETLKESGKGLADRLGDINK